MMRYEVPLNLKPFRCDNYLGSFLEICFKRILFGKEVKNFYLILDIMIMVWFNNRLREKYYEKAIFL